MPLELVTIPCRSDNYVFVIRNPETGETALVDASEEGPIVTELDRRGWRLDWLLITHHHPDHVEAVEPLRGRYGCHVIGAAADAHRLPELDTAVSDGDRLTLLGEEMDVLDVSGHTVGHIAFHFPKSAIAFTADSLMALGCGRLFEGTPEMMWTNLKRLRDLPGETVICSGHEYTAANGRFALTIEPGNSDLISRVEAVDAARSRGEPTVPSTLDEERRTNPFLRADLPELKAAMGLEGADDVAVFAEIRGRKDRF